VPAVSSPVLVGCARGVDAAFRAAFPRPASSRLRRLAVGAVPSRPVPRPSCVLCTCLVGCWCRSPRPVRSRPFLAWARVPGPRWLLRLGLVFRVLCFSRRVSLSPPGFLCPRFGVLGLLVVAGGFASPALCSCPSSSW
jgi:hypothetical protein